ncbi:interferon-induced, double-stranded RNA-activated protein kinase-like [Enoplosus armatus]|uniref:interferon-induced, double-stranded RNA-activated protein kinase-like n=1 Tax=Enoplosus armatus TaxID=215367 RepID=UPI003994A69F
MDNGNYVARLGEFARRKGGKSELHYEDLGSTGPDHNKTFIQRAVLNGKVYPEGVGKNKKDAKQNAAKNALKCLKNEHQDSADSTENATEGPPASVHQTSISSINYICWLNEYGQKKRVTIRAVESTRLGPHDATPCCSFVVGDQEYPAVTGETKREAKEKAAKLVYDVICGSKTTDTADENYNITSTQQKEELNQNLFGICNETRSLNVNSDNSSTGTNYIGIVNHYCQKTNSSHAFIEESRCGPPHNPQFLYKLVINKRDYPVGEGKTVKEAKQNAAQLAWSALQEQSDWDSKVSLGSTVSEDDAPTRFSTPSSLQSLATPQSMSTGTSGSGIFTNSLNSSTDQHAVKDKNMGKSQNETWNQPRFTSDFDPMECLGSGAFGFVYKARNKVLDKYYAVKIVRCQEIRKSLREVGALSDLHHRNIIRYYTFWIEDSGYQGDISTDSSYSSSQSSIDDSLTKYLYIQMELCDTKTLRGWIDEKNAQSLQDSKRREESLHLAQQIISGVEYIHSKGLIHRDLKPANILFGLEEEEVVKIGDFGLVTTDDDDGSLMDRTVDSGTPTYMAPEQKRERNYDRRVDIFALGLIYLELLWKVSLGHERAEVLLNARRQRFPTQFSLTFPQENQIIKAMLCEKPEGRPEASKLKAELEKWAQTANAQNLHHRNQTV